MNYYEHISSEKLSENWTPTAVDCYNIGCRCSKCLIYKLYFKGKDYRCKMKESVRRLVEKFGKPEGVKNDEIRKID